jgi:single-stranded DNA-specific DHH superfamily exonuclease
MAISKKQIEEIRDILRHAKKPLFFFDDDPDGLSSFLLLYRWMKEGTGVVVKASPKLGPVYLKKVEEIMPDVIIILDKPMVDQEFLDGVKQICKPTVIWIDHHQPQDNTHVKYYNPRIAKDSDNRPTNYWCWQIVKEERKDDLWIAMAGCIGDWFLPEFTAAFCKRWPDLMKEPVKRVEDALFNSKIGRVTRVLSFIQKGPIKKTMSCIKILTRVDGPEDFLEQKTSQGKYLWKWFSEVNGMYISLLKDVEEPKDNLLMFIYAQDRMSFTADLSNELLYKYPDKTILVGRDRDGRAKCSVRDTNRVLPGIIEESMHGLDGHGGGHDHACGMNIASEDFDTFLKRFREKLG